VFEGDFWGKSVAEFSHSLGRKLPFNIAVISLIECPVSVKADIQPGACEIGSMNDRFTPGSGR